MKPTTVNTGTQKNLCLQGAAGLRAGVVELRSLTNDDGAGANDQQDVYKRQVHTQLNGGDSLPHGSPDAVANAHHIAGGHHLGAQRLVGVDELIKRCV